MNTKPDAPPWWASPPRGDRKIVLAGGEEIVLSGVAAIEPLMGVRVYFENGTFRDLPDPEGRVFAELLDATGHGTRSGPAVRVPPQRTETPP
jgi:hypothetical protein